MQTLKNLLIRIHLRKKGCVIFDKVQFDRVPNVTVDKESLIEIRSGVIIRPQVELRAVGGGRIILGYNVKLDRGVRIIANNGSVVKIGDGSKIGLHSVLNGGGGITLGTKCLISGFVYIQTSMHRHEQGVPIVDQGFHHSPIELGDDVWLGAHVTVLPGCSLGNGTIVGSNAVVTKPFGDNVVIAGVPARLIKHR